MMTMNLMMVRITIDGDCHHDNDAVVDDYDNNDDDSTIFYIIICIGSFILHSTTITPKYY